MHLLSRAVIHIGTLFQFKSMQFDLKYALTFFQFPTFPFPSAAIAAFCVTKYLDQYKIKIYYTVSNGIVVSPFPCTFSVFMTSKGGLYLINLLPHLQNDNMVTNEAEINTTGFHNSTLETFESLSF